MIQDKKQKVNVFDIETNQYFKLELDDDRVVSFRQTFCDIKNKR
jgi:hypothetical protein